jgi:hypothetical protein
VELIYHNLSRRRPRAKARAETVAEADVSIHVQVAPLHHSGAKTPHYFRHLAPAKKAIGWR